ncbi:hypothetical protein BGX33_009828 [Mortierella sp. NVP41]|nr:hypothetical protein BGX33_009828 [Mortierella sp. NVP41]
MNLEEPNANPIEDRSKNWTTDTDTDKDKNKDSSNLQAVDSTHHHKDIATSESGRKRKGLNDLTTAVVSDSSSQSHPASSSSKATISSSSSSSLMPAAAMEAEAEPEEATGQDRHLKRTKVSHVGDRPSITPFNAPVDLTTHARRERKRRLSDDLITPIVSGSSTPGRLSASPSHSVTSVSTPSSSVPASSVSPVTARGPEEQDHNVKRPRVYDVDEDSDNDTPTVTDERLQIGPIVIGDDDDDEDADSNQAEYDNSFSTQDNSILLDLSVSVEDDPERREPSPAHSDDSDATITQRRVRATRNQSTAAARASSVEHQAEPATSPRHDLSRSPSTEPQLATSQAAPTIHSVDDDPDNEEVIEVIDLTRQPRNGSYPRGDSLPRVPGLSPQHSFQLPTLQRLVSRSSQSAERSQTRLSRSSNNNNTNSIDILEIPDDDDEDGDIYGRDTVRIDSEIREVQLDPQHPWSRGPIQLIVPTEDRLELEGNQQQQIEDVVDVDDHLPQIDYGEIESESDEELQGTPEVEDDGVTDRQVDEEVNYILNLRRDNTSGRVVSRPHIRPPQSRSRSARQGSFQVPSPSFTMRSPSYEAQPMNFPTTSRRSATPQRPNGQHSFSPVARRPSPVRLILRDHPTSSSSSSSARSSQSRPSFPSSTSSSQRLLGQGRELRQILSSGDSTPINNQSQSQSTTATTTTTTTTQRRLSSSLESASGSWISLNLKCSICMETMSVPTMTRCGHAFCRSCIHLSLNTARHCPMCRQPTTKTRLQELEFRVGGGSSRPVGATSD